MGRPFGVGELAGHPRVRAQGGEKGPGPGTTCQEPATQRAMQTEGPWASQAVGSPLLSREVVSHRRGSVTRDPPNPNPCLSSDLGSLSLQAPWLPLKRGMGKIVPTCKDFGAAPAMDPSRQIHGYTSLMDTKHPRGLGMNLGQSGAAGNLPGPPLQHFPAKCLSFPTCNEVVRAALGTWLLREDAAVCTR